VLVGITRSVASVPRILRPAYRLSLAVLVLILGCDGLQNAVAEGDTRTISLHHVHTNEDLTITYKRNGRYDEDALKKINWILRDWRRDEEIKMDPHLMDLVWEVQREVGAKQPIQIICGYRAPQTNAMLRRRSGGVAQFSQHTLGRAMDFYIPGVPLEELRVIGLRLQRGGVGFYPTSGSPFVHLDVGNVRHWQRMTRDQLVRVFPNGRTVHIPSDGQPLPGYALALADIERRGSEPSTLSINTARNTGVIGRGEKSNNNVLAKLFGFGKDDDGDAESTASIAQTPTRVSTPPVATAAKAPPSAAAPVPTPRTRPATVEVAAAIPTPVRVIPPSPKAPIQTASAGTSPWPQLPREAAAPELALAYAATPGPEFATRPAGMNARMAPVAASIPAETSVVMKQQPGKAVAATAVPTAAAVPVQSGQRFDDPWLRAAILAPDLQHYMTVTMSGAPDFRSLTGFMQKPSSSVMMSFSDEPEGTLTADRFSGHAVVFVATVSFNLQTASLHQPVAAQ
jgi:uncharacterized protein YcbK (DUF882 family)